MSAATAGPCDRGIAHGIAESPAAKATPHPTGTLAATILGSSLAFIDGSVVNVGLSAIERDLGAGGASIGWLTNPCLLPLHRRLSCGDARRGFALTGGGYGGLRARSRTRGPGTGLRAVSVRPKMALPRPQPATIRNAGTGRWKPLRTSSPAGSTPTSPSRSARTRCETRISPPRASPHRRAARLVTVPIAP